MQSLGVTWRRVAANAFNTSSAKVRRIGKIAFSDKCLLYTNVSISVTLSSVGDLLQQQYEIFTKESEKVDTKRTTHMAISGATVGVLCHNWYKILDKFIVGKSVKMVSKKLILDQFIFSPVMLVIFFGTLALFEEEPLQNFKDELSDKFVTLYQAEWMVWPPAQIINFYFLPTRFRVLYDNTISLGYDVYTSKVKNSAPTKTKPLLEKAKLDKNASTSSTS
ncbi:hypothetical protein JYU34_021043 [Plutella xylostella]|uniref:Mpv17-like protein 2 n=1 Tax=Plutella xylostella TaxID=51655 RepID=A0ABQ7PT36_PLUXY|nr:hypothetical protein JYU34_021043 [Plutella xylostella]